MHPTRRGVLLGGVAATAGLLLGVGPAAAAPRDKYDRKAAVEFARAHALDSTDSYLFDNNCTWFVSQALWAGGLPETGKWTSRTLDYDQIAARKHYSRFGGPSKAAANADFLKNYLAKVARVGTLRQLDYGQNSVPDARTGDLIFYDGDLQGADGKVDHVMMITGFSQDSNSSYRYPLVSGHSVPALDQGWTWSGARDEWMATDYSRRGKALRAYLMRINY